MREKVKTIYDLIMVLLVVLTILTLWIDHSVNSTINTVVWLIFLIDYLVRIFVSKNKWEFVKKTLFYYLL
ncbi:hypothetical protein [Gracilibacillus sp. YIM 98692]|uniref:hypothetical protein n=1 Tax=Gracilibacillus sp. YIM 98692 TaxID=2663532 RepID=UPI001F0A015F|nr:hypothetical protein [Gracilibacillus sp. YIM 98692]